MAVLKPKYSMDELGDRSHHQNHHGTSKYSNANDSYADHQNATANTFTMPQVQQVVQQRSQSSLQLSTPTADELKACLARNTQQQMDGFQQIISVLSDCYERMKIFGSAMSHIMPVEYGDARELKRLLDAERKNRAAVEENMKQALEAASKERDALEADLINLKRKVSMLSAMPGQVSDAMLRDQLENIWQQAHTWVKTNFRKLQPARFHISILSQSSIDLIGDFMGNMHGFSQAELLKVGLAIVGRALTGILGDFYFGLDRDMRPGTILDLSEATNGTGANFIVKPDRLLTFHSHRSKL